MCIRMLRACVPGRWKVEKERGQRRKRGVGRGVGGWVGLGGCSCDITAIIY